MENLFLTQYAANYFSICSMYIFIYNIKNSWNCKAKQMKLSPCIDIFSVSVRCLLTFARTYHCKISILELIG